MYIYIYMYIAIALCSTVCPGNRESFEQVLEGWALAIRTHSSRQGGRVQGELSQSNLIKCIV